MAGELERIGAELDRLRGLSRIEVPQYGVTPRAQAVWDEAAARGAIIEAAQRLTRAAGQADSEVAQALNRLTLETTARLEAQEKQYTGSPRVEQIKKQVTDTYLEQNFAHNLAFYQGFGEQVIRQITREIPVPSPQRGGLRFGFYRD